MVRVSPRSGALVSGWLARVGWCLGRFGRCNRTRLDVCVAYLCLLACIVFIGVKLI